MRQFTKCVTPSILLLVSIHPALSGQSTQARARAEQRYANTIRKLTDSVPSFMARHNVLGAAIAMVEGNRLVWSAGFGFTDQSRRVAVQPSTVFSIQSISKTYTTVAFMRMVAAGQLRLDQTLRSVVPEFTVQSRQGSTEQDRITFRLLLAHRAGLPHEAPRGGNFDDCDCSFDDHAKSVFGSWLKAPVGDRYAYSNVGVDLVGYAMQRRAGVPFAKLMRDVLLLPLGMTQSTFDREEALRSSTFARGQIGGRDVRVFRLAIQPAGGLYSNVRDMAKFVSFELAEGRVGNRAIVPATLLAEMARIQFPVDGQSNGYGLGLERRERYGLTVLNHGGGGFGYQSEQRWIPSRNIGVVVLTNYGDDDGVAVPIADMAIEGMLADLSYTIPTTGSITLSDVPAQNVDSAVLSHLVGSYRGYSSIRSFKIVNGNLSLVVGTNEIPLAAHGPAEFTTATERFYFRLDNTARPIAVDYLGPNGTDVFFPNGRPDEPMGPNRPEWAAFVGTYVGHANGEPFTSDIFVRNGYLYSTRAGGTRLIEYRPGFFFTTEGEAVVFNGSRMSLGNRPFVRRTKTSDATDSTLDLIRRSGLGPQSRVVPDIAYLTDVIGPRLSGSLAVRKAGVWAAQRMRANGVDSVWQESYTFGRAWHRGPMLLRLRAPFESLLYGASWGWSPGTRGNVVGDVVFVGARTLKEFETRYAGRIRGKWVMLFRPYPIRNPDGPPVSAADSAALAAEQRAVVSIAANQEEREYQSGLRGLLAQEGIAGILRDASKEYGLLTVSGSPAVQYPYPVIVLPHDTYTQFFRLLSQGEVVRLEASIDNQLSADSVLQSNTVAEIRGLKTPAQVVIVAAHLDSWDLATGATDNAVGAGVVLEALRLLKLAPRPDRTIRFILFTGEEQTNLGSIAYAATHRAEMQNIQAVLVLDNGTGRITGVADQGQTELHDLWGSLFAPLSDLGPFTIRNAEKNGSDHVSFTAYGVPGFSLDQEDRGYDRTHHSQIDTFDHVVHEDVRQASIVMAALAYQLANRAALLPRRKETR